MSSFTASKGEAHVGAEFFDGEELVVFFAQCGFDGVDQIPAVTLVFAGDALDIFGIDAETNGSGFHNALVL